jgi:Family of unknown function (DUF6338)
MPGLSYQVLGALLILLPGFLTVELVRAVSTRPQRTDFDKVVQAFIYSFLAYVCFSAVGGQFPLAVRSESSGTEQRYFIEPQISSLLGLLLVAILLGLLIGVALHFDFPISLLRSRGWTQRTFQVSVWNDCFRSHGGYVQVELADGRNIIGWLRFFSDAPEESSLFLEDAAWLRSDGKQFPIVGSGILLTKDSGIKHVMFLKANQEQPALSYDT